MLPVQKEFEKEDIYEELKKKEENTNFSKISTGEADALREELKDKRFLVSSCSMLFCPFCFSVLFSLFSLSLSLSVFVLFFFFLLSVSMVFCCGCFFQNRNSISEVCYLLLYVVDENYRWDLK